MKSNSLFVRLFGSRSELVLIVSMVGILLVLFSPIPSILLDFLLIANFSFAMLILLLTFYMDKPIKFSTFPSILLIATLFRLALNIAATRLILTDGDAGKVIGAIGAYVVGGNYVIGLVVFLILIVVQYVVVTSGAQRVAEVAARFTLDSMPGKQMSIDADLNMGIIDEKTAQERRKDIEREANFYGSMDGASKFVKGDAIAGILIILIDIIGGLTVGIAQRGLSWGDALHLYTLLTVGDGIVTQIPALVISTATGIIVTRAASDATLGEEVAAQITDYPKSLIMISLSLFLMLFLSSLPVLPIATLFLVFAILAFVAFRRSEKLHHESESDLREEEGNLRNNDLYQEMEVSSIELLISDSLIELIGDDDGLFMEKIKSFRKQFASEMGFVIPAVKIRDNKLLNDNQYDIRFLGASVSESYLYPDRTLAISASTKKVDIEGIATKDPSFGLSAVWIKDEQKNMAKSMNLTLVDPMTVMITHFCELVRRHAYELLTRDELELLLSRVKATQHAMYEELIPNLLSLGDLQRVLQGLLEEKVSIRNIKLIIETLIDKSSKTKNVDELIEHTRSKLAREICKQLMQGQDAIHVLTLDPILEQHFHRSIRVNDDKISLVVDPSITEKVLSALIKQSEAMMLKNYTPVLLCSPSLRRHLKKLSMRVLPTLNVLALTEIPDFVQISSFSTIKVEGIPLPNLNLRNTQTVETNAMPESA